MTFQYHLLAVAAPQAHSSVAAGGKKQPFAKANRGYFVGMTTQDVPPRRLSHIQNDNGLVLTARCEQRSIRAEGNAFHAALMTAQNIEGRACRHDAQAHGTVGAGSCQDVTIRAK